ncbi:class I SAM-dependent methyltransferase [Rhodopirellula sp.]|nr:class I SAM-dependent methyltransferase [Rhodopirellula sp.]MDB4532983.1 class I SAM-dependent methyltransferase [bacterium]
MKTEMRNGNPMSKEQTGQLSRRLMTLVIAVLAGLSWLHQTNNCSAQGTSNTASSDEQTQADKKDTPTGKESSDRPRPVEEARNSYLGRVLAKPMSHLGAPWLIRPEREDEEQASESFKQLEIAEGMSVCDLGCGNGYWTLPMARDVGEDGRVYAVDIQREMLQKLRQRSSKYKLNNIEPVLGEVDDPNLPADKLDLVLMVDVYHEFSHPESMLWGIRRSLNSKGVVALLEYREEDPRVPIKPLHKMSKRQIMKEYSANGFKLVREYNKLPWQHLMFFARDDSPLEKIEPVPAQQVLKDLE